ncbi:ankyrin repeat-containing protein ITN1-like [Neltuma alba]|uniref:ankyrin repeat-containing protein ITN1-like n=1 Tax=Neltuma alba TaxID=207710 RepID=UPI0010A3EC98|nr:ankyrin repeat-containing protein ITN1-like [Prosopis alba]
MEASDGDTRNTPRGLSRPQLRRVRSAEFGRPRDFLQALDALDGDIADSLIVDIADSPEVPSNPLLRRVESAEFKRPSLDLLQAEERMTYFELCVPLHKYASEGNWKEAKAILDQKRMLLGAAIAEGWATVLHVAAGAGYLHFVKELVNMMKQNNIDLDFQDEMGNTAFTFATIAGNLEIVDFMLKENQNLPKIRSRKGFTPILFAALQGRVDLTKHLYSFTVDGSFEEGEWKKLFLTCIESGIYGLALHMLKENPALALATNEDDMTGLHYMAQTLDWGNYRPEQQIQPTSLGTKHGVALELVHLLWQEILKRANSKEDVKKLINEPSRLLFDAAKVGNFDFLATLIKSYPDLMWQLDDKRQTIIHIAVLYRHPKIFNLIHDMSGSKDIILSYKDKDSGNSILHLAAMLAPANRLELVSGAAFQMKFELLWFEEVRKIVLPSYMKRTNLEDKTPRELFTEQHTALRKDAESWMKGTAKSCMLVSTLIATGVFTAAFSIPGGINDDTGVPNYLGKRSFMIFAISDAIAMISSSASILIFLSILVSRYAEYDFHHSLPSKLIFGLITLFISITSMMIAFSSAFFITYDHGLNL